MNRLEQTILAMRASARRRSHPVDEATSSANGAALVRAGFCDALAANFARPPPPQSNSADGVVVGSRIRVDRSAARAAQASRDDRALAVAPKKLWSSGVVQAVNGRWLKTYTVRYDDGETWTGELRKLFYELVVVGGADAGVREASAQRKLDCENLADTIALAVQLSERHPLALTELRLARVHVKGFEGLLARAVNLGLGDREQCSLLMSRTAGYAATLKAAHETLMRSKRFGVLPATAAAEDTLADGAVRDAVRAAQPGATWDLLSTLTSPSWRR